MNIVNVSNLVVGIIYDERKFFLMERI